MASCGTRWMIALVLTILVGCAPKPILLDEATKVSLGGVREIRALYYTPPNLFVPVNPVPGMFFGAIGGAIAGFEAMSRSEQMVKAYGLIDPIIQVKTELRPSVQTSFPDASIVDIATPRQDDALGVLKGEFQQGLLLDLKTIKWGIFTKVGQGDHYVSYQGRARLVQLPEEKVVWQGVCDFEERDDTTLRHITDFEANNGALLKEHLTKLATICSGELTKQLTKSKS